MNVSCKLWLVTNEWSERIQKERNNLILFHACRTWKPHNSFTHDLNWGMKCDCTLFGIRLGWISNLIPYWNDRVFFNEWMNRCDSAVVMVNVSSSFRWMIGDTDCWHPSIRSKTTKTEQNRTTEQHHASELARPSKRASVRILRDAAVWCCVARSKNLATDVLLKGPLNSKCQAKAFKTRTF